MKREDGGGVELAAATLVGLGGVGEAVAEDDVAGGEGGEDDLGDGLRAVGEHEGELGEGVDRAEGLLGGGGYEERADAVTEGSAAGLAGGDDMVTGGEEVVTQEMELGGFTGAVETFEGDEVSARHGVEFIAGLAVGLIEEGRPTLTDAGKEHFVLRDSEGTHATLTVVLALMFRAILWEATVHLTIVRKARNGRAPQSQGNAQR